MGKKSLIQIFLIVLLFIVTLLIFNHFYISNNSLENPKNKEVTNIEKDNEQVVDKNIIENVQYSLNNNKGDIYQVLADFGEINLDNPNLMFLTNVNASLILANKTNIILTSDFANFNTKTFETTFIKNIKVERDEENLTARQNPQAPPTLAVPSNDDLNNQMQNQMTAYTHREQRRVSYKFFS